ncbi:MAG: chemotaxis response regulator protein-glutamate methylesterase [Sedimenticola sp.]|nr:chemotaxis response regulator protein-glutamate methylesterase [Sedimenticola sp.]MCW8947280.1 chemotaxis response regulator protein-glutamate methylesterase [Sedimenticola sp.]MCW8950448.1 chemotaxis response regulator protein-glutamate methylesterase [Sedimenticola sp.]MCW8976986.1 chemotaxis response regulator protein-glutamate methylesterase [Sedimenticola sp.]
MIASKVRVLVVDDSSFFRRRIADILGKDPGIEVVGFAGNGESAITEARRLKPDVITMDVEMPVLDGISAVKRIVAENPTPIIMFSSLTHEGARATLDALDAGAVDFLPKQFDEGRGRDASSQLARRVLAIGSRGINRRLGTIIRPQPVVKEYTRSTSVTARKGSYKLVAIGASTGGPVAIQGLLAALPESFALPIIIVVHMPASFTSAYAERLNSQCAIKVTEASDGDLLQAGHAYLAPGGKQMVFEQRSNGIVIRIKESSSDQTYRPCVDVSFGSAARLLPANVLAIILTGMGSDGKQAARLLKDGGSTIWSQNEESCVVYGMPQAVEKAGLSDRVLPLIDIGPSLVKAV